MNYSGENPWQKLRRSTSVLLAIAAVSACSSDREEQGVTGHPPVDAKLISVADVHLRDGTAITLDVGTMVTATCLSGGEFNLRAAIKSGHYQGDTAEDVPRADLVDTTDPYHAHDQHPPQDPFGPLPPCDSE